MHVNIEVLMVLSIFGSYVCVCVSCVCKMHPKNAHLVDLGGSSAPAPVAIVGPGADPWCVCVDVLLLSCCFQWATFHDLHSTVYE